MIVSTPSPFLSIMKYPHHICIIVPYIPSFSHIVTFSITTSSFSQPTPWIFGFPIIYPRPWNTLVNILYISFCDPLAWLWGRWNQLRLWLINIIRYLVQWKDMHSRTAYDMKVVQVVLMKCPDYRYPLSSAYATSTKLPSLQRPPMPCRINSTGNCWVIVVTRKWSYNGLKSTSFSFRTHFPDISTSACLLGRWEHGTRQVFRKFQTAKGTVLGINRDPVKCRTKP